MGSIPGLRSIAIGNGNLFSCPENSMGRGAQQVIFHRVLSPKLGDRLPLNSQPSKKKRPTQAFNKVHIVKTSFSSIHANHKKG